VQQEQVSGGEANIGVGRFSCGIRNRNNIDEERKEVRKKSVQVSHYLLVQKSLRVLQARKVLHAGLTEFRSDSYMNTYACTIYWHKNLFVASVRCMQQRVRRRSEAVNVSSGVSFWPLVSSIFLLFLPPAAMASSHAPWAIFHARALT
jgi:hypothetical protein